MPLQSWFGRVLQTLSLGNIFEWNQAALALQLWRIVTSNSSSIWAAWFNKVLLKNKGFWTAKIPCKCSLCLQGKF